MSSSYNEKKNIIMKTTKVQTTQDNFVNKMDLAKTKYLKVYFNMSKIKFKEPVSSLTRNIVE